MMKLRHLVTLLLCTYISFAQQTPDAFMFGGGEPPIIVPQSPEAGKFGRFGSIPISSATGQMGYSIPFYNIEVDGHNWPIALSYNYGGLILEGKPSLMGLGWSLQADAAVTREVRGLPDEDEYGYYSYLSAQDGSQRTVKNLIDDYLGLEFDNNSSTKGWDTWNVLTLENFVNGVYDSEVDKYTVNVGGLHFSFKLKDYVYDTQTGRVLSASPYFLSKHANKVEIEWAQANVNIGGSPFNSYISAFVVTDTNGIVYRFDQREKSVPQGRAIDPQMLLNPTTAWKLSSITYLNNQTIDFTYSNDTFIDYNHRASGSVQNINVNGQSVNPNAYQFGPYNPATQVSTNPHYGEDITEGQIERKILTGIIFPKGQIDFNLSTNPSGRKLYDSFELYNNTGTSSAIKTFSFSYSGNRDFLDDIQYNGDTHYQFEYHDELAVPNFIQAVTDLDLARKQDDYKFYNGANNQFALNIPNSPVSGVNKNVSLLHTRLGALKRIIYPTKGSTNVYYEQNQIKTDFVADSQYYESLQAPDGELFQLNFDAQLEQEAQKNLTIEVLYPTVALISHTISGNRAEGGITLQMNRLGESYYPVTFDGQVIPPFPGANNFYYDVAPYLRQQINQRSFPFAYPPMYPGFIQEFGYADTDGSGGNIIDTISESTGDKILMMPGTYVLSADTATLGADVRGTISIQTYGEFNVAPPSIVNKSVGGVRVDYMKDCPDGSGENCFITNYDYNDDEGYSTGNEYVIPLIKTSYRYEYKLQGDVNRVDLVTYLSNPFTVSNPGLGTPVFYSRIKTIKRKNGTVKGLAQTEIGRTETTYSFPYENILDLYPRRPTGVDLDKSLPLTTRTFEQGQEESNSTNITQYTPIRKPLDLNTEQDQDNDHPWSLKVFINKNRYVDFDAINFSGYPNHDIGSEADVAIKSYHGVLPYRELDIWDRVKSVTKTIDGITTSEALFYNENQKVDSLVTVDSRNNFSKVVTKYANDFAGLAGMAALNQLSEPVLVETYYNNVLQSTQETKYDTYPNGIGYKPSKVFSAKSDSDLEAKMQFTYGINGQIRQVDQLLDSPNRPGEGNEKILKSTAYIWGYTNEYPVVKVDNATYAQVIGAGANTAILQSSSASLDAKRAELQTLRNSLPNAFVSGYIYKPLVGVSNMVDARGYTTNYAYDYRNRLLNVKDEANKMLEEYEYQYRSQNYVNPDVVGQYPNLGGSINGSDTVDFGVASTYVINPTGGSDEFSFTWYVNDVFYASNVSEVDITFDTYGQSTVRADITDTITGDTFSASLAVTVDANLGAVTLTATPSYGLVNTQQFTFDATGINTGQGTLRYEWTVDNGPIETFNNATGFQTNFDVAGEHSVQLKVVEETSNSFIIGAATVNVLNPLSVTLTADKVLVTPNETITFTPSVPNNNGLVSAIWSIVSSSGTQVLSYEGTEPYQHSFSSVGTYEVIYKLRGHQLGQEEQASVVVTVTDGPAIGAIVPSATNILLNNSITFTKPSITNGSGNYTYKWFVDNVERSTIDGNFTYNGFATEASYDIKLEVRDTDLNVTSQSSVVQVNAWKGLGNHTIGASTNPIYTNQAVTFSSISTSGGSGSNTRFWYVKYENNAETFAGNTANLATSFSNTGTYTIRLRVVDDLIANHETEDIATFEVYNALNVGSLTANPGKIITGTPITFTAPTVSGGSNSKNYQWLVNGVQRSTSQGNFTYNQFNTAGDYDVTYRVTDNTLGITQDRTVTINVYNPLNSPSFGQPVSHIEVGEDLYMATSNNGGGSGSRNYKWYVKLNSGSYSQIPGANGTSLTYNAFSSVGTYTIKFRVTDNNVPTHFKETTKVVNVYAPIQISNSDISTPATVQVNTNTYFNINAAGGGSDNFEYEWDIINQSVTPNYYYGVGTYNEANRNVSNFNMGFEFVGASVRIQCRIHDLLTGKNKTVYKIVSVQNSNPITGLTIGTRDNDLDPETAAYSFRANGVTGGSGSYNYRWVINGAVVQEGPSNSYQFVYLDCSKQSETVTCVAIDAVTGQQILANVTVNLGFNCGGQ